MFVGYDKRPLAGPTSQMAQDFSLYKQVMLAKERPLLVVRRQWPAGTPQRPHNVLVSDPTDVITHLTVPNAPTPRVFLLSPPALNGTDGWLIDELAEIWLAGALDFDCSAVCYVTCDGRELVDPLGNPQHGYDWDAKYAIGMA